MFGFETKIGRIRLSKFSSEIMRRLVLFRHAKARPADGFDESDRERPLSVRGAEDAPRMGRYLAAARIVPDLALISDSQRTQDTFALAAGAFGKPIPVRLEPSMYEDSESWIELLNLVHTAGDKIRTLMVIGHNPSIGDLAAQLSGSGDRQGRASIRTKFPTSGVAIVDFDVAHWADVRTHGGRLDRFVTPASLGGTCDD